MNALIKAVKDKWAQYLLEIVVIVFSILGAFALEHWNEQRKEHELFLAKLDIIYNQSQRFKADIEWSIRYSNDMMWLIDKMLVDPDTFMLEQQLLILNTVAHYTYPRISSFYLSPNETFEYEASDVEKQMLVNQIHRFIRYQRSSLDFIHERMQKLTILKDSLIRWGIPRLQFNQSSFVDGQIIYAIPDFYTSEHYQIASKVLKRKTTKDLLKTTYAANDWLITNLNEGIDQMDQLNQQIAQFYPEVGLKIYSLGIVGDQLPSEWEESVPMINLSNGKWQLNIALDSGEVKFRANNQWFQNWGGDTFPEGKLLPDGPNIAVKEGSYTIIVDLEKNTYSFVELDPQP